MKRFSLCLTLFCAAALPLTAAALDYGPDQRILAAEGSAPALPSAHGDESPFVELTTPHRTRADDEDTGASTSAADADAHPAPTHAARRSTTPTASSAPGAAAPARNHSALSWQSLLPGSIQ